MVDKLELVPGPGLVARFGDIAVWAGPQASHQLVAHLVAEAQKFCAVPGGADQMAQGFVSVLQRGDPEPQAPFALIGPGANRMTLFLHGPVQAWDSGRWLAPQPVPGWMLTSIERPWPLIVLPYGAPPPAPSAQGNPFNLVQGVVPGAGFVLLRQSDGAAAHQAAGSAGTTSTPGSSNFYVPNPTGAAPGPAGVSLPGVPGTPAPATSGPSSLGAGPGGPGLSGSAGAPPGPALTVQQASVQQASAGPPQGAQQYLNLREGFSGAQSPLPVATEWQPALGHGRLSVIGVNCEVGHFNHPKASICGRCGRGLPQGAAQVSGPRPPVGVLLADDGCLWSLAQGCLIGQSPATAAEVSSGSLQPITMQGGPNHPMGAVHAEVQLRDWDVYLVDRRAEGGTFAQLPGDESWCQLPGGGERLLTSGAHISCGGRVLTFLSAWPT